MGNRALAIGPKLPRPSSTLPRRKVWALQHLRQLCVVQDAASASIPCPNLTQIFRGTKAHRDGAACACLQFDTCTEYCRRQADHGGGWGMMRPDFPFGPGLQALTMHRAA